MSLYNPAASLARSIHQALTEDLGVRAALGDPPRLYDNPPEDPVFPYLTYGAMRTTDLSGDDAPLTGHMVNLHVWSRYGGRAEVLDILNVIRAVMESDKLTMNDTRVVTTNVSYADTFRAADGRTLHGLLRLSVHTEPLDYTLGEVA